jgi:hypothetical protein
MGWTAREKDGLQERRMDCKRKGWTAREKDGLKEERMGSRKTFPSRRAQKGRQT